MSAKSTDRSEHQQVDALKIDELFGFDGISSGSNNEKEALARLLNKRGVETEIQEAAGRLLNKRGDELADIQQAAGRLLNKVGERPS